MKMIKNIFLYNTVLVKIFILLVFSVSPLIVPAATVIAPPTNPNPNLSLKNPLKVESLDEFIQIVLKLIQYIGIYVSAGAFAVTGLLYGTANGRQDRLRAAHYAFLGAAACTVLTSGAWIFAEALEGSVNQLALLL